MASFACNTLLLDEKNGVLTLTLNRPEVRNAFNAELIGDLHKFCDWINAQGAIRMVFLKGAGKVFCAGGDLNWMKSSLSWSLQENYRDAEKLSAMFQALNAISKPLIGLIHGGAYGGGVGLTAVCDHVVCEKSTQFSLSEVRLGLIPACIGPFVVDKVGQGAARSLFISGERFSAPKAQQIGLVHEIVDSEADLEKARLRIVDNLMNCGPHAIQTAKTFLASIKNMDFNTANQKAAHCLADLRVGREAQEGILAFLEKRKPQW